MGNIYMCVCVYIYIYTHILDIYSDLFPLPLHIGHSVSVNISSYERN